MLSGASAVFSVNDAVGRITMRMCANLPVKHFSSHQMLNRKLTPIFLSGRQCNLK